MSADALEVFYICVCIFYLYSSNWSFAVPVEFMTIQYGLSTNRGAINIFFWGGGGAHYFLLFFLFFLSILILTKRWMCFRRSYTLIDPLNWMKLQGHQTTGKHTLNELNWIESDTKSIFWLRYQIYFLAQIPNLFSGSDTKSIF